MKKISTYLLLIIIIGFAGYKFLKIRDYRRDSRHFFTLENGHSVTMWRTVTGICYVIPGKYSGSEYPPPSESYITSPFTNGLDIIWEKGTDNLIVNLEDEKEQTIHQSPSGVKLINYNSNKKFNDSTFLYSDGTYNRYKKDVDFINIDIKEEFAGGSSKVTDQKF